MGITLKTLLGYFLVIASAPALAVPKDVMGVLFGQSQMYASDVNGEAQNSNSAGVIGIYGEHNFSDVFSVYADAKKTQKLLAANDDTYLATVSSIEVSAKYSVPLSSWVKGFGRVGADLYKREGPEFTWHLAHSKNEDSGVGVAFAFGLDFNPQQGKVHVGLAYGYQRLQNSENVRTLSVSIGSSL